MAENKYGRVLMVGICAVLFFIIAAYSIPGFLVQTSNPSGLPTTLNVGASVYLYYSGAAHIWPTGTYGSCYILQTYTDCANAGTGSSASYSFAVLLFALMGVFFCIMLLLVMARRAHE